MRTRLCEVLKIDVPVVLAPMGPSISSVELAAAVSNAGGLGIISFGGNPPPLLQEEIRRLRSLTDRPFGVNMLLQFPVEDHVALCIEQRVPVVSFFWGDCSPFVKRVHEAGLLVMDQVGSVSAARRSASAGVDIVVAQGVEAGGHVAGTVSTLALVPRVVDEIAPTPVVAAGGIADARGVAAALALGAQGVLIGTRFLASQEAAAHPVYKQKILEATEEDTVRTTLFGRGWPNAHHRTLRTPFVERWLPQEARGSEERPDEPLIGETRFAGQVIPLQRFAGIPPGVETKGEMESMNFLAGQGVGLVNQVRPAAEIVTEIMEGARQILRRLAAGA